MKIRHLIRTRRLHVWFDPQGRWAGPTIVATRQGKNGSPAGFGPKMWPAWFKAIARPTGRDNGGIIHWDLPTGRTLNRIYRRISN
jgi:hypothetical protein